MTIQNKNIKEFVFVDFFYEIIVTIIMNRNMSQKIFTIEDICSWLKN